jgi:acyl-CoA dehydrogenase
MANKDNKTAPNNGEQDSNLAEDVLRQSGKSEDEVKRTGAVDRADDQVERMFEAKHRTANSPVHKAVWDRNTVLDLFKVQPLIESDSCTASMEKCLAIVSRHRDAGTLYDANNKVSNAVIDELAGAGYWGMLIEKKFGGQEASIYRFMKFLTTMSAKADPTTAGLASIHGCIGAVDPLNAFGNDEQKAKFLPMLAAGKRISGFALTEPQAGSDLTALKTTAVLVGDNYVVNGEKLFISNAIHGRMVGLVAKINDKPAVLVVELPETDTENFALVNYGLHALTHTYNNGLKFTNFLVPKENLLHTDIGDGLTIAYHGLNRGRVALCANAAGVMRLLLRSISPESWGNFRETYGQPIEKRELVQARMARAASLIVGADALVAWCSSLLDEGYRGELECIIAKVFGSEAQKEVAIEVALKSHGGRSFLKGHIVGDNIHDYLAPCIYEGEGQMLSMALFKTLAKDHGMTYMLPLGNNMGAMMKNFKKGQILAGLGSAVKFILGGIGYTLWQAKMRLPGLNGKVSGMDKRLAKHVKFAQKAFRKLPLELSGAMVKHQLKLADRQQRIALLSERTQLVVTMLVTAQYANQVGDAGTIAAADVLCRDLTRKLTGAAPSDDDFRAIRKLGELITEGKFTQIDGVPNTAILRKYSK